MYRNLVVLEQARVVRRIVTRESSRLTSSPRTSPDITTTTWSARTAAAGPATPRLRRASSVRLKPAIAQAAQKVGFRTAHHRLDLVGMCADCS